MKDLNPFLTKDYISSEYFCDRDKELKQLVDAIENQRNTTIISQRKIGKTALIKHLLYSLRDNESLTVHYFDIYPTQNLRDFTNQLCNALIGYFETKPEKIIQKLLKLLGQFRPKLSLDEYSGKPSLTLDLQTEAETGNSLGVLFNYLSTQEKKVVIAIDEFQQITRYPEKNVEAILRSHIQGSNNICMIYSGSNRHMLTSLFSDYARPFYQSSGFLFLEKIDPETYKHFISGHFGKAGRAISPEALDHIIEWTLGITYYVQEICNRLYSTGFRKINIQEVKNTCLLVLEERAHLYQVYRELLTGQQFKLLIALAKEVSTEQPTSSGFVQQHNLGAVSTVKRSLDALENKNLIFPEEGKYVLPDVFLMRWLQRQF
jgi:uncharacterized protein